MSFNAHRSCGSVPRQHDIGYLVIGWRQCERLRDLRGIVRPDRNRHPKREWARLLHSSNSSLVDLNAVYHVVGLRVVVPQLSADHVPDHDAPSCGVQETGVVPNDRFSILPRHSQ